MHRQTIHQNRGLLPFHAVEHDAFYTAHGAFVGDFYPGRVIYGFRQINGILVFYDAGVNDFRLHYSVGQSAGLLQPLPNPYHTQAFHVFRCRLLRFFCFCRHQLRAQQGRQYNCQISRFHSDISPNQQSCVILYE